MVVRKVVAAQEIISDSNEREKELVPPETEPSAGTSFAGKQDLPDRLDATKPQHEQPQKTQEQAKKRGKKPCFPRLFEEQKEPDCGHAPQDRNHERPMEHPEHRATERHANK